MRFVAGALFCLTLFACRSVPEPDPRYRPAQTVLEVVSVLRRHVPDDTYRFPPTRDFAGRNVYRASLLRLENLETAYLEELRAGHMDDVIAFAKGRAFERLRAFSLASTAYEVAGRFPGPLQEDARRSRALCEALDEAARLEFEGSGAASNLETEEMLERYEQRIALLSALLEESAESHYATIVREELERTDMERAAYVVARRSLAPDGNVRALAALQRLVVRHRESKLANRHVLALANLYAEVAGEYVEEFPPESLDFDPPTFQELVESAARLYEAVANQDGSPEKLEAARRLEAFLAFTIRVDRDRFSR